MTPLVVESPASVTAWSMAHALAAGPHQHAVLIVRPGPADEHARDAQAAETRPTKEQP